MPLEPIGERLRIRVAVATGNQHGRVNVAVIALCLADDLNGTRVSQIIPDRPSTAAKSFWAIYGGNLPGPKYSLKTIQVFLQHRVAIFCNSVPVIDIIGVKSMHRFPFVGNSVVVGVLRSGHAFQFRPATDVIL